MMWRTPPEPNQTPTPVAGARRHSVRSRDRQRIRLVSGLRSVARHANTPEPARRYQVLLCKRAMSVRPQLLEAAAALERVPEPEPDTLETLRWLLTDGCTSPLYNPAVPPEQLRAALDRVQAQLDARERSALPSPTGLVLTPLQQPPYKQRSNHAL